MLRSIDINQQPSQTLAKGLLILEAFSIEKTEWGVRDLARELNMHPTTVTRLLTTLQNAGYVTQNPDTQRYQLGAMVMRLSNIYSHHNPLPRIAEKVFENYSSRFAYNFYLGRLDRDEVIYLAVLDGRGPIKVEVTPGGATGLHSTALGKVLLAFQSDRYIRQFIDKGKLQAYTSRSLQTPEALWEQIYRIREQGFAVNDGEHFDDVAAVGAPLFDSHGQILAGVSLAYPRLLKPEDLTLNELIALVQEIAQVITDLQFNGAVP